MKQFFQKYWVIILASLLVIALIVAGLIGLNRNPQDDFIEPKPFDVSTSSPTASPTKSPSTKDTKGKTDKKGEKTNDKTKKVGKPAEKPKSKSGEPTEEITLQPNDVVPGQNKEKNVIKADELPNWSVSVAPLGTIAKIDTRYGGVDSNGSLSIPPNVDFALYKYGAKPGDKQGTIFLASHINHGSTVGPLKDAYKLKAGDKVYLTDGKGKTTAWNLTTLKVSKKEDLNPSYFTKKGDLRMVLMTCGGKLLKKGDRYTFDSNITLIFKPID